MSDERKGGRGQCQYCGEWHSNVSYHSAIECKKRPNLDLPVTPIIADIKKLSTVFDAEKLLAQSCFEWAESHTYLQNLAKKYYSEQQVEGNSYSVPGIEELADLLDAKIKELQIAISEAKELSDAAKVLIRNKNDESNNHLWENLANAHNRFERIIRTIIYDYDTL